MSNSERERLHWEATETWIRPAVRHELQSDPQPIRIENGSQPALTLPTLRREWLQPTTETSTEDQTSIGARLQSRR